jgi:hypothetical protein
LVNKFHFDVSEIKLDEVLRCKVEREEQLNHAYMRIKDGKRCENNSNVNYIK